MKIFNIFKKKKIKPADSYDAFSLLVSKEARLAQEIVSNFVGKLIDLRYDLMCKNIEPTHYYISPHDFKRLKACRMRGEPLFKDMCLGMRHIIREGPLEVIHLKED